MSDRRGTDVLVPVIARVGARRDAATPRWEWMLYYKTSIPSMPAVAASWTSDTKAEARWHLMAHAWIFVAAEMQGLEARAIARLLQTAPTMFGSGDAVAWSLEELTDLERAWHGEVDPATAAYVPLAREASL